MKSSFEEQLYTWATSLKRVLDWPFPVKILNSVLYKLPYQIRFSSKIRRIFGKTLIRCTYVFYQQFYIVPRGYKRYQRRLKDAF